MADSVALLQSVFKEVLNLPREVDVQSLKYQSHGWDSVAHMALVAGIEQAFDVMLSTDEVIGMSSFERAKEILAAHGAAI